jgi:chromosome segregation ATPase
VQHADARAVVGRCLLFETRKYAEEWGRWRETIEHLKKTAAGQQKRADKLEQRLDDARQSILCVAEERDDARAQLRAASAELDHARREAAAWEVQCQDLRDKLVQTRQELEVEKSIARERGQLLEDIAEDRCRS